MTTTQDAVETSTRYVLEIRLEAGEELHAGVGSDREVARNELRALHARANADPFLLVGEDTMVRSRDIKYVQLREDEPSRGGIVDALKSRVIGGGDMSTYETERTTEMGGGGARAMGARPQEGQGPGFFDQYGYGHRPWKETKPFFLTSEFLTLMGIIAGLAIAMGVLDNFDAPRGWLLITIIGAAYLVSRGLAKSGTRDPRPDGSERGYR